MTQLVDSVAAHQRESLGRVLVVDDEENIRDVVGVLLRHAGYDVVTAGTGRAALRVVDDFHPDVIVLDVMLPDVDGFEVCRRLRTDGQAVGVLFLTARDRVLDKVSGLSLGGDDYLTKPFSLDELVARVKALQRRSRPDGTGAEGRLEVADLVLDDATHQVWRDGHEIALSVTEHKLLRYFMANPRRVLSKEQLLEHVWGWDFETDSTVVETYISYLRRKLDPYGPPVLHTVRGVGYILKPPEVP